MDINFELYKVFYYVANTLSFSEASNHLFISQSAVSQSIKLLEEKMGCKLLFRNTKQVKLTREGQILYNYVEQAFNFIKSGERSINELSSVTTGEIRIGASDTICKYYLMPYFKSFIRLYPNIKIHVTNRTSPKCVELLKKGSVDFSLVNLPEDTSIPGMNIRKVKDIQDVFIAGNSFPMLKGRKVSIKELEDYPVLVLEKDTVTRKYFDSLMKNNNVSIQPEIESGSVDLLVEMSKIGLGIAFVISDCINDALNRGEIFTLDLEEKIPPRGLGLLTLNSMPLPAAAQKFISLLG